VGALLRGQRLGAVGEEGDLEIRRQRGEEGVKGLKVQVGGSAGATLFI